MRYCLLFVLLLLFEGAEAEAKPAHWAFEPLKEIRVPASSSSWVKNDIDRFVLKKLIDKKLLPNAVASKEVLIRRVTYDLIGLPPHIKDVEDFLKDESDTAFAKVVDRLLASRHYGERWGRHWLDLARYADTSGDAADYPIPQLHKYRNYVFDSFNKDKPYDVFVQEQIAGDLMVTDPKSPDYADKIIATGYVALSQHFGVTDNKHTHLVIADTLDTIGKSVLGLSIGCARCHDHKRDPISTEDYYALYGFFNSTQYAYAGCENIRFQREFVPHVAGDRSEAKKLEDEVKEIWTSDPSVIRFGAGITKQFKELHKKRKIKADPKKKAAKTKRIKEIFSELSKIYRSDYAYGVKDAKKIADSKVQIKGNPNKQGKLVKRGFLTVLDFPHEDLKIDNKSSGRLQLAKWLTHKNNPLTARVMVNRIWQHHFGVGLVTTHSDFGLISSPPSHPELLDYLAQSFMKNGWSFKKMHRLMLLSNTYQLSSADNKHNTKTDEANTFLWRANPRRLDAEALRDTILLAGDALNLSVAKEHPFPAMYNWMKYSQHVPFQEVYKSKHRSVYLMTQRFKRHPYLALFDGPDTNKTTATRMSADSPLQSLFFLNSEMVKKSSSSLAKKILKKSEGHEGVKFLYQTLFARKATKSEILLAINYLKNYLKHNNNKQEALASYIRALMGSNEFIYLD
jgi:hypothetical protein